MNQIFIEHVPPILPTERDCLFNALLLAGSRYLLKKGEDDASRVSFTFIDVE
jgi:hypothetical protein